MTNLALIGALRFFLPAESVTVQPEAPPAATPVKDVSMVPEHEIAPTVEVSVVKSEQTDPVGEWRDRVAQDPHAVLEWAAQQPADENRNVVLVAACYEIANVNPAEAIALAEKYALTNHSALANLTERWARQDFSAAHTWVLAKPAGEERNDLAARVGYVWSAIEPTAAAEFVVQEIPPGSAQTEAAISVLHQWALHDFAGAKAWAELFPHGETRQRAMNELAGIREYSPADAAPGF